MRVPCTCTDADYECDMNYVRNKGGKCEIVPDPLDAAGHRHLTEKEEDCALEGFYTITQGYRKIPGNQCYGGNQLEPYRRPCTSFAWLSSIISFKTLATIGLICAILYYGWPIIEAVILVLPIPDPKDQIEKVKAAAGSAADFVQGSISGPPARQASGFGGHDYSANLDQQPEAFMAGDDDSDEDIGGKPAGPDASEGLDYDSDEKNDEELVAVSGSA